MNDADDIDIYEDFEVVDLSKECEKLQAEIAKLQEENSQFLNKIEVLVNEKEKLVQKNRILQKNISTLLKTAKEEIKRKDAKILELRVELTKVQAKKNIKENYVEEPVKTTKSIPTDIRSTSNDSKVPNKEKPPTEVLKFDKRHRLSEKIDDNRLPRTRREDDRYRKYPRRRSRSPVRKSKSKSPHRKRIKSPVGRKRKRSRSPAPGVKHRRSRTRSPKKISRSPVRSVPCLEKTANVSVKSVECVDATPAKKPTSLPLCKPTEIADKSATETPEEPKTDSTVQNLTMSSSIEESPVFSEIREPNESIEREDGEIVSDQGETADPGPLKTLYSARMQQRLKLDDENRAKEMKPPSPPKSAISPKEDNIVQPEPPAVEAIRQSVVETYSPFKNNYKLVPWSPAPNKPSDLPTTKQKRIAAFDVDKPVKPLALADISTGSEGKKTEPQAGFDIKTYRIPKKTDTSKPFKKKTVKPQTPDEEVVENGVDKTDGSKEARNDIANFEIFKTINSKNTSSSSLDVSSESRRLHNDLHLTDSDPHADSEETTAESSGSSSNSGASDIMEQFL